MLSLQKTKAARDYQRSDLRTFDGCAGLMVWIIFRRTVVDDSKFIAVKYDKWARSKLYEHLDNGTAKELLDTVGFVGGWDRI